MPRSAMSDIDQHTPLQELMQEVEAKFESMQDTIHSQAAHINSHQSQIDALHSESQEFYLKQWHLGIRMKVALLEKDCIIEKLRTEVAGLRKEKEDDQERIRCVRAKWLGGQGGLGKETGTKRKRRESTSEQPSDGGWGVSTQNDDSSAKPAAKKRVSPSTASSVTVMDDFAMDYAEPSPAEQEDYQGIRATTGGWFRDDYDDKAVEW